MNQCKTKILIVEDDVDTAKTLSTVLGGEQIYDVRVARNGKEMRTILERDAVGLILLDLVLDTESGLDLAREVRARSNLPIIILSGKADVVDRVVGLEIGADDYITKPFHNRELIARVSTVLRRFDAAVNMNEPPQGSRKTATFGDWTLNMASASLIHLNQTQVRLTAYEFEALTALAQSPNVVLSRNQLLEKIAKKDWEPFDRSLDVLIAKLRKKLCDDPKNPRYIRTVRNLGYMFVGDVSWQSDC